VAAAHGVTDRTVRNWMKSSRGPPKKEGRPGYSLEEIKRALWAVGREWKRQGGRAGWRTIEEGLGKGKVQTRLLQRVLKLFKARARRRKSRRIMSNRQSVTVHARDAVWSQDGTHLGRIRGSKVDGQVLQDRATTQKISTMVVHAPTTEDVMKQFETTKKVTGRAPLVWQSDNDPIYCAEEMQAYLEREKIISLLSRVYTPTDNGAAECGMSDLKGLSGLGKGVKLSSIAETAELHGKSAVQLNENRLRASRGYRTANTLCETMTPWYDFIDRARFYQEARREQELAVQGKEGDAARHAERQAVFMVMEKYGLVTITRGGKAFTLQKVEIFL